MEMELVVKEKLLDVLETCGFTVAGVNKKAKTVSKDNWWTEIEQHTPAGEDWIETIWFDGTYEGFIHSLEEILAYFDIDERVEVFIPQRGKNGCPDSILALYVDAEWKRKVLSRLSRELQVQLNE